VSSVYHSSCFYLVAYVILKTLIVISRVMSISLGFSILLYPFTNMHGGKNKSKKHKYKHSEQTSKLNYAYAIHLHAFATFAVFYFRLALNFYAWRSVSPSSFCSDTFRYPLGNWMDALTANIIGLVSTFMRRLLHAFASCRMSTVRQSLASGTRLGRCGTTRILSAKKVCSRFRKISLSRTSSMKNNPVPHVPIPAGSLLEYTHTHTPV